MPFAFIMGVEYDDAFQVAEMLGVKTFLNEFIAYERLGIIIKNRVLERGGTVMSVSTANNLKSIATGIRNSKIAGLTVTFTRPNFLILDAIA